MQRPAKIDAVIAVSHPKWAERPLACVVLKPGLHATADEFKAFAQGRIAHYKVPQYVEFVDALPMTITGKVQKFVMRDKMIEELGLSVAKTA